MDSAPHADPPFKEPIRGVKILKGPWQKITIEKHTDGDQRYWPAKPYRTSSDLAYNMKLAQAWAEKLNIVEPNINYYLNELPRGYAPFETDQAGGGQIYKRLFGHPSGTFYDSIPRFQEHFMWLMGGMVDDCPCILCAKSAGKPFVPRVPTKPREVIHPRATRERFLEDHRDDTTRSNSASGLATGREKRGKPFGPTYAVDEEGTKDVYKECIESLYKARESRNGIEDDIREEDSPDYGAEHHHLTEYLTRVGQQHSFVPRLGELVLWCNYFPDDHYLLKDTSTNEYKFYSFEQKCFHGFPDWRAGVVTTVPNSAATDGPVDFQDILDDPAKRNNLNTSGFRVETIPDPNNFDKTMSKQYRYVPMRSMRPLSHWQQILKGFPKKKLHKSIYYGLTCMTSLTLVEKYKFTGRWPNGSIHCRGLYIGSELITVGDTIRILPQIDGLIPMKAKLSSARQTDIKPEILAVSSIRLNLNNIDPIHTTPRHRLLSTQSTITLIGSAYTLSPSRDYRAFGDSIDSLEKPRPIESETAKGMFHPIGTIEYGPFFPLHHPQHRYEVSHDQVLGRLYESHATKMWTGASQFKSNPIISPTNKPNLTFDIRGVIAGREYATLTDERIPSSETESVLWHLTDTRALGLAIATANGLDIASYDSIRTKKMLISWRAALRLSQKDYKIDGRDLRDIGLPTTKGHKAGTILVNGKTVYRDDDDDEDAEEEYRGREDGMVSWVEVMRGMRNESGSRARTGKRAGRPPGTRVIDGKLVYPHQLADYGIETEGSWRGSGKAIGGMKAAALSSPSRGRHASQMQQAAREDTESDDLDEEELLLQYQQTEKAVGTLYDGSRDSHESDGKGDGEGGAEDGEDEGKDENDNDDQEENDDEGDDGDMVPEYSGRRSLTSRHSPAAVLKGKDKAVASLTKQQIMASVQSPDLPEHEDDDDDKDDEDNLYKWINKPGFGLPARDGIGESEGGDYQDGDTDNDDNRRVSEMQAPKVPSPGKEHEGSQKLARPEIAENSIMEERPGTAETPRMADKGKGKERSVSGTEEREHEGREKERGKGEKWKDLESHQTVKMRAKDKGKQREMEKKAEMKKDPEPYRPWVTTQGEFMEIETESE